MGVILAFVDFEKEDGPYQREKEATQKHSHSKAYSPALYSPHGSNKFNVSVGHFGRNFCTTLIDLIPKDGSVLGTIFSYRNHIHNVRNEGGLFVEEYMHAKK